MSDNVRAYYDQAAEREWNRLMTTSQIEYFITLKVINDVIDGRKGLRILDLGGGPGRYAIELSKQGHEVILVDLSEGNLELATKKADDAGVTISRRSMTTPLILRSRLGQCTI
jgi:S-adenosylmethionine-dependent methyltransferase